jgi:hypothetical protein
MPIYKFVEAPNGVTVSWHTVISATVDYEGSTARIEARSWPSKPAFDSGFGAAWSWTIPISQELLTADSSLSSVEDILVGTVDSPFYLGSKQSPVNSLDRRRLRRLAQIDRWRAQANNSVSYESKTFSMDELSWKDVVGTNGWVTRHNELPPGWPGVWKAIDGSSISITSVGQWDNFYSAIVAAGAANFARSAALKNYVNDSARTEQEIDAVTWDMVLPT